MDRVIIGLDRVIRWIGKEMTGSSTIQIMVHSIVLPYANGEIQLKFMFSKKATKIDKIFTVDLTLCSKCQIDGEDFVNFCGFLRKHKL